jgi:TusA-related sulfurtransferase
MSDLEPDLEVDVTGRPCPLPMLDVSRRIADVPVGGLLLAVTDNSASLSDLPAWSRATGHEIVSAGRRGEQYVFLVRRVK